MYSLNKEVTVIIPALNVERYIVSALQSVELDAEHIASIIVIDNGSDDGTVRTVRSWSEDHPSVEVLCLSEFKRSACSARNKGIHHAHSPWIRFLDADDVILPGSTSMLLQAAKRDEKIDVVYGDFVFVDGAKKQSVTMDVDPEKVIARMRTGHTGANLFRRASFENYGLWDESWSSAQENELMNRWASQGARFVYAPGPKMHYVQRMEAGQISSSNPVPRLRNRLKLSLASFRWHRDQRKDENVIILSASECFNSIRRAYDAHPQEAQVAYQEVLEFLGKRFLVGPDVKLHYRLLQHYLGLKSVLAFHRFSSFIRGE